MKLTLIFFFYVIEVLSNFFVPNLTNKIHTRIQERVGGLLKISHSPTFQFPQIKFQLSNKSYACERSWLSIKEAASIQKGLTKLVNIRNLTASTFRLLFKPKGTGHYSPIISRSPFSLRWAFPSILLCYLNPTSDLILRLYISFDSIYARTIEKYYEPISSTVSIFNASESEKTSKFIKIMNPNLVKPEMVQQAAALKQRDFYNVEPSYIAVAKMMMELVNWCNLTVVYPKQKDNIFDNELLIPGIYPRAFTTAINKIDLEREIFYETPAFYRAPTLDLNFMYCDVPKTEDFNPWGFTSMLKPFQNFVWISIGLSIVTVSFVILLQINMHCLSNYCEKIPTTLFNSIVLSLISSLVSTPVYFGLKCWLRKSLLYVIWVFACLILSNFYNGIVTSLLIQPIPVKMLENLGDLIANNYSLVFADSSPTVYDGTLELVAIHKQMKLKNGNIQQGQNAQVKLSNIEKLEVLMANPKSQYLPDKEFLERVAYGPKSAVFGAWLYVYLGYQRVMDLMKTTSSGTINKNHQKRCYVGKKLFTGAANLWTFYPPNAEWIYGTFLGFVQNGIDKLWVREFYGLNYAKRVQDRRKVLSPTELAPDPNSLAPKPIQLRGSRFLTVIMTGVVGLTASILCFLLECCGYISQSVEEKG